jgi:hypothetical protein
MLTLEGCGFHSRWGHCILCSLPYTWNRTMTLGSTQSLAEMSTRNLPEGKERQVRKADNLTAIYEPTSRRCRILDVTLCYRPLRRVTGIASLFTSWEKIISELKYFLNNLMTLNKLSNCILMTFKFNLRKQDFRAELTESNCSPPAQHSLR